MEELIVVEKTRLRDTGAEAVWYPFCLKKQGVRWIKPFFLDKNLFVSRKQCIFASGMKGVPNMKMSVSGVPNSIAIQPTLYKNTQVCRLSLVKWEVDVVRMATSFFVSVRSKISRFRVNWREALFSPLFMNITSSAYEVNFVGLWI